MIDQVWKAIVVSTALTFCSAALHVPIAVASSEVSEKVDLEITVKVHQKGFSDKRGKLYDGRNILKIPKGQVVRITFVFDESMTSLAYGDTHQIAVMGNAGWTKETEKIWMLSQQAHLTFQSGNEGEQYRAYCIIDCIGMEHLNNLIILAV